jgi:hypothetical protein
VHGPSAWSSRRQFFPLRSCSTIDRTAAPPPPFISAKIHTTPSTCGQNQATHAQLAAIIRGHWGIEDRLHWVRDLDFDEDRSQIRTANGPRIIASLRNLVITILRLSGATSIATELRHHARHPARPLQTIMKC